MRPWILEPRTKWTKAVLASDPSVILGHAGWLTPSRITHEGMFNLWRRDAAFEFGWAKKMGWSTEEEAEIWEHVDVEAWQGVFKSMDPKVKEVMGDEPFWFLAPIWVFPEWQKRGVATLLLKEVMDVTDNEERPTPILLESFPDPRSFYEGLGWKGVEDPDKETVVIRRGPDKTAW